MPRDAAVDAVLTAETLFGQFTLLLPRLTSTMPADVSVAMGEAQALYPELWAQLDRARAVLRERGIDVPAYDEARERQPATMLGVKVHTREKNATAEAASWAAFLLGGAVLGVVASAAIDVASSVGAKQGEANRSGLRDARVAIDALRTAMPEVDWKTLRVHEAREAAVATKDLSRAGTKKMLLGLVGLAVVVLVGIGLVKVLQGSRPPTPEEVAAKEQQQFNEARDEISELNAQLKQTPCDTPAAERRVKLFETHKQMRMARSLAKKFLEQCGDNAYLRSVADNVTAR